MSQHPLIEPESLVTALAELQDRKVLILGDIMLDRYIFGSVDRISPEAPVPVVFTNKEQHHLGGAGNVARNIKHIGAEPVLVGICGHDDEAGLVHRNLQQEGIEAVLIEDSSRATTVKTRVIAQSQQVVRIDRETGHACAPSICREVLDAVAAKCDDVSVILVSDYAKGLITSDVISGVREIASQYRGNLPLLVDPKPKNHVLYKDFFLMTPNAGEAAGISKFENLQDTESICNAGIAILQQIHCVNLLITLGAQGMVLFKEDGQVNHIAAMAQSVFDVTGAGDTVIAMLGASTAAGHDLLVSSLLANYAAGLVVGKIGAATVTPEELTTAIRRLNPPVVSSWR